MWKTAIEEREKIREIIDKQIEEEKKKIEEKIKEKIEEIRKEAEEIGKKEYEKILNEYKLKAEFLKREKVSEAKIELRNLIVSLKRKVFEDITKSLNIVDKNREAEIGKAVNKVFKEILGI